MIRGETQYNSISRFVKEIPEELFEGRIQVKQPAQKAASKPVAIKAKPAAAVKPFIAGMTTLANLQKGSEIGGGAAPDYVAGDRVVHMKFGEGTVLSVEKRPKDYEVSVDFDNAGVKKMFAGFAKLRKI